METSFTTVRAGEQAYVVSVDGDLDLYATPRLAAELEALVADAPDVVLDLTGAPLVDSTALGAIVSAGRGLKAGGGRLSLVAGHGATRTLLELVGIDRVVPVYDSAERALEHLVGGLVLRRLEDR